MGDVFTFVSWTLLLSPPPRFACSVAVAYAQFLAQANTLVTHVIVSTDDVAG